MDVATNITGWPKSGYFYDCDSYNSFFFAKRYFWYLMANFVLSELMNSEINLDCINVLMLLLKIKASERKSCTAIVENVTLIASRGFKEIRFTNPASLMEPRYTRDFDSLMCSFPPASLIIGELPQSLRKLQ